MPRYRAVGETPMAKASRGLLRRDGSGHPARPGRRRGCRCAGRPTLAADRYGRLMPRLWVRPAATSAQVVAVPTRTGVSLRVTVPSPSWP